MKMVYSKFDDGESRQPDVSTTTEERKYPLVECYKRFTVQELSMDLPPVDLIIPPWIQRGRVNLLVGPGGVNKTTLAVLIGVTRALGQILFLGETPLPQGETLFLTTEDQAEDYLRKIQALRLELKERWSASKVARGIHLIDASGIPLRLVQQAQRGGQYMPTDLAEEVAEFVRVHCPKVDLVFFETSARLTGGVESNEALSTLIESLQLFARLSGGVTPIVIGHVSQDAGRRGIADQYAARGGSAGSDNSRGALTLTRCTKENRRLLKGLVIPPGIDQDDLRLLVHSKPNAVKRVEPIVLQLHNNRLGPVLRYVQLLDQEDLRNRDAEIKRIHGEQQVTIAALVEYLRKHPEIRHTKRSLREDPALQAWLQCGKHSIEAAVELGLARGLLSAIRPATGMARGDAIVPAIKSQKT